MEPFPIQEILLGISLQSQKNLQKFIHANMTTLFRETPQIYVPLWFFHNPGGFLSMCFCLWVGAVLVVARCCRMSRLAVTCSTAVGSPMSPVSLSKKMLSCRCKKDKDSAQTDVPEHFLWVLFPSGYIQDAAKELANPWREGHSFKIRFWKMWSSCKLRLNLLSL